MNWDIRNAYGHKLHNYHCGICGAVHEVHVD